MYGSMHVGIFVQIEIFLFALEDQVELIHSEWSLSFI